MGLRPSVFSLSLRSTISVSVLLCACGCQDNSRPAAMPAGATSVQQPSAGSDGMDPQWTTGSGLAQLTGMQPDEGLNLTLLRLRSHSTYLGGDAATQLKRDWGIDLTTLKPDEKPDLLDLSKLSPIRWLRIDQRHSQLLASAAKIPTLRALSLKNVPLTDADCLLVRECSHLAWLDLSGSVVSPEGMAALKNANEIQVLYLNGSATTDETIRGLGRLPNLRFLSMRFSSITDESIKLIAKQWPTLEAMDVYEANRLTVQSIDEIVKLQNLKYAHVGWLCGTDVESHARQDMITQRLSECELLFGD